MRRRRRVPAALLIAGVLTASGCTSVSSSTPEDDSGSKPVTITFWHAFKDDAHEVKAVDQLLTAFHAKYPNITVKAVKAQDDDKINQAIRGGNAPDVAMSFNANQVGGWCSSGAFQDLAPALAKSKVDTAQIPKAVSQYTEYRGKRCFMPWLADTFGLYYNKKLLADAGLNGPPKTMTELADYTRKLTKRNPDGTIKVAGFVPYLGVYETVTEHLVAGYGGAWLKPDGASNVGGDPAFAQVLTWQKNLVDWFGVGALEKFKAGLGDEFSAQNGFETGKIAMITDGEWRTSFIANDKSGIDYATAPMPVADDRPELYGGGFVGGNVIGIPRGAPHPAAAWTLIRYLTTDTDALVSFANAIGNVPTTLDALASPKLTVAKDPRFTTFLGVFKNPATTTTPASPDGGAYLTNFGVFAQKWQTGKVPDLVAGLKELDRQNDTALELSK
jgi:multiple sugar transport system substrate-binding protein